MDFRVILRSYHRLLSKKPAALKKATLYVQVSSIHNKNIDAVRWYILLCCGMYVIAWKDISWDVINNSFEFKN